MQVSSMTDRFFTVWSTRKAWLMTLLDPKFQTMPQLSVSIPAPLSLLLSSLISVLLSFSVYILYSVQSLSRVQLFATTWTAAHQASCPPPTPWVYSNSCPLSQWCHPIISSSVIPFSSCLQSSPASGSFPISQFFASCGQSIGFQLQHQSFQWIFRTDLL